jgi:hypothetical protein
MTDFRASMRALLEFERPTDLCQYETGYWPDTIERWRGEGLPAGKEPWEAAGITYYDRAPVNARFCPPLPQQVLSESDGKRVIRSDEGVVKEESTGRTAFPRFISHPVSCLADFEALQERFDPNTPQRFPPDWQEQTAALRDRQHILVMGCLDISFFGWHRDLMGLENLLLAYYDQPQLIHAISRQHLHFLKTLYARVLQDVEFEFIFMWEDMCFKNGPLISPALFREFMVPYYKDLIGFFKDLRPDYKVIVDTDGDAALLLPLFIECGVDGMMPFEVAAGMDIRSIAQDYPKLFIFGGLDKRELAKGRAAIDRELEAKLPPLFARGGYLPCMDHHVPPEVSWEDFRYYLERTREIWRRCQ